MRTARALWSPVLAPCRCVGLFDTNKDNRLDRWCYYNAGVEVYRESDTDFNEVADEFRWLSTEGLRWGKDANEDGVVDAWNMISAEEVTAEVVRATASRDADRFARLLITESEIEASNWDKKSPSFCVNE